MLSAAIATGASAGARIEPMSMIVGSAMGVVPLVRTADMPGDDPILVGPGNEPLDVRRGPAGASPGLPVDDGIVAVAGRTPPPSVRCAGGGGGPGGRGRCAMIEGDDVVRDTGMPPLDARLAPTGELAVGNVGCTACSPLALPRAEGIGGALARTPEDATPPGAERSDAMPADPGGSMTSGTPVSASYAPLVASSIAPASGQRAARSNFSARSMSATTDLGRPVVQLAMDRAGWVALFTSCSLPFVAS